MWVYRAGHGNPILVPRRKKKWKLLSEQRKIQNSENLRPRKTEKSKGRQETCHQTTHRNFILQKFINLIDIDAEDIDIIDKKIPYEQFKKTYK